MLRSASTLFALPLSPRSPAPSALAHLFLSLYPVLSIIHQGMLNIYHECSRYVNDTFTERCQDCRRKEPSHHPLLGSLGSLVLGLAPDLVTELSLRTEHGLVTAPSLVTAPPMIRVMSFTEPITDAQNALVAWSWLCFTPNPPSDTGRQDCWLLWLLRGVPMEFLYI